MDNTTTASDLLLDPDECFPKTLIKEQPSPQQHQSEAHTSEHFPSEHSVLEQHISDQNIQYTHHNHTSEQHTETHQREQHISEYISTELSASGCTQEHPKIDSQVSVTDSGLGSPSGEDDDEPRPLRQISNLKPNRSTVHKHKDNSDSPTPGVILLGRGNSFSLGRSEVIILNRRNQSRTSSVKTKGADSHMAPVSESHDSLLNECVISGQSNGYEDPTITTQTPHISNGLSQEVISMDLSNDLDLLWAQVEAAMTAKQSAVQQVLEEFGVGDVGEEEEEEGVWQVLLNNNLDL